MPSYSSNKKNTQTRQVSSNALRKGNLLPSSSNPKEKKLDDKIHSIDDTLSTISGSVSNIVKSVKESVEKIEEIESDFTTIVYNSFVNVDKTIREFKSIFEKGKYNENIEQGLLGIAGILYGKKISKITDIPTAIQSNTNLFRKTFYGDNSTLGSGLYLLLEESMNVHKSMDEVQDFLKDINDSIDKINKNNSSSSSSSVTVLDATLDNKSISSISSKADEIIHSIDDDALKIIDAISNLTTKQSASSTNTSDTNVKIEYTGLPDKFFENFINIIQSANDKMKAKDVMPYITGVSEIVTAMASIQNISSKIKLNVINDQLDVLLDKDGIISKINTIGRQLEVLKVPAKSTVIDISSFLQSITGLANIDNAGYDQLVSNLRRLISLTSTENILSKVGLSNKGLIRRVMQNIVELAKLVNGDGKYSASYAIKSLSYFLQSVIDMSGNSMDTDKIEEAESAIYTIIDLYGAEGPYRRLIDAILEFSNDINDIRDVVKNTTSTIQKIFDSIYETSDAIDFKKLSKINIGIASIVILGQLTKMASSIYQKVSLQGLDDAQLVMLGLKDIADDINSISMPSMKTMFLIENMMVNVIEIGLWSVISNAVSKTALKDFSNTSNLVIEVASLATLLAKNNSDISNGEKNSKLMRDMMGEIVELEVAAIFAAAFARPSLKSLIKLQRTVRVMNRLVNSISSSIDIDDVSESEKKIKSFGNLLLGLSGISILATAMLVPITLGIAGLWVLSKSVSLISTIVDKLKEVKVEEDEFKQMMNAGKLIAMASIVMLLGAAVGSVIMANLGSLLLFTGTLSLFILSVVSAYKFATKGMEDAQMNAEQFRDIVVLSSAIMLFGGLFLTLMPAIVPGILAFTGLLAIFIAGISAVYKFAAKQLREDIKNIETVKSVIFGSAAIMMIGALWMMIPGAALGAIGFAFILSAFLLVISAAYRLVTWIAGDKALQDMKDLNMLIVTCAATMAIGAFFMMIPGFALNAFLFAVEVSVFVAFIGLAYSIFTNIGGKKMIKSAKELNRLIVISAATLIIGGLFMLIPGMPLATLEFAIMLGVFIGAVTYAFAYAAKKLKKGTMGAMIALTALVVASSIVMLAGGLLMINYPDLIWGIPVFLFYLALMIAGMIGLSLLANRFKKQIGLGLLAIAGIELLVYAADKVMKAIVGTVDKIDGRWDDMEEYIKKAGIIFGGVIGIVAIIAAVLAATKLGMGIGAIGAAEALVAGIVGIVYLCAKAMDAIADSMLKFQDVEPIDFGVIGANLAGYLALLVPLGSLAGPITWALLKSANANIHLISEAISDIGQTIHTFASMTVPIYKDGKQVGVQPFGPSDAQKAADNVSTILTCLGGAIQKLYEDDKGRGIFGNYLTDFLRLDTPFTRVVKSCNNMGKMISSIAEGVKDMATLHVPYYVNGKKAGYRSLNDSDFKLAKDNIGEIVKTLGDAIMYVYNNNPHMFSDQSFFSWLTGTPRPSKTPFGIVMTSCTAMGKMISSIASGLKDMAKLRIPIYKGTQVVGYDTITSKDFDKVGKNIKSIILCLATGIVDAYNEGKKGNVNLFDDPSHWYEPGNRAPIAMAIKTFKGIGGVLSEMVKGLNDIINLKIPYVENGKVVQGKFVPLDPSDIDPTNPEAKLTKLIRFVIEALPSAMMSIYDAHLSDGWWQTDWKGTNSKFGSMKKAFDFIKDIVAYEVKGMNDILNMKIDMSKKDALQDKVNYILSALPNGMQDALYKTINGKRVINDIFSKSNEDLIEEISNKYGAFKDCISSAVEAYGKVISLMSQKIDKKQVNLGVVRHHLIAAITTIPDTFHDMLYDADNKMKMSMVAMIGKNSIASSIRESYKNLSGAISEIIAAYNNIAQMIPKEDSSYTMDTLSNAIESMLESTSNLSMYINPDSLSLLDKGFVRRMQNLADGMAYMKQAYSDFPDMSTLSSLDVAAIIRQINKAVSEVENTHKFARETRDVHDFVESVNSLDLNRTSSMIDMVTAIDRMASNIDGLDKFTKTIANELTQVLAHLTEQLRQSSVAIDKAERIQRDRHKNIQESIYKINSLLNNPVQVIVSQEDQKDGDDQNPDNDTSTSNDYIPSASPSSPGKVVFTDSNQDSQNTLMMSIEKALKNMVGMNRTKTGSTQEKNNMPSRKS